MRVPSRAPSLLIGGLLAGLLLAGCGDATDRPAEEEVSQDAVEEETLAPALILEPVGFDALPGWRDEDFDAAILALSASCARLTVQPDDRSVGTKAIEMRAGDFDAACTGLPEAPPAGGQALDPGAVRHFFEGHFAPFLVRAGADGDSEGLFTGYFEAELNGARQPSETFATPLYGVPDDLVVADLGTFSDDLAGQRLVGRVENGRFVPYPERGAIDTGYLADRDLELLWIDDPVDAFLLQVQGSGRVVLPDGGVVRVGFAGHNGQPYRSIGRALIERGELEPHAASWSGIRGWIADNPDKAQALFAENPRYIFFREIETAQGSGQDSGVPDGPIGAQGVPLTPRRSLAVDRSLIPLGLPIWLDTTVPGESEAPLRRLMVAQDTGGAITGAVRGDFFWGYGDTALAEAGRMRSRGRYFLLLPIPAAERLSAPAS